MRKHLRKTKNINDNARILGLDIGRKYTGLSISDQSLTKAKPFRTLICDG